MDNTYLCHHGVKGMHWGVRRYQNEDGSYTDKGRKRYGTQAARKYYKIDRLKRRQEHTESFRTYRHLDKRIRKVQTRYDRKVSGLTEQDINRGRQRVAGARAMRRKVGVAVGTSTAALGLAALGLNPIGASVGVLGAVGAAASAKRLPYYQMEKTMYRRREQG